MSTKKCSVPGCINSTSARHRFPKNDLERMRIWIKRVANPCFEKMESQDIYRSYRICGKHFSDECYSPGKVQLNTSALPTLYLPEYVGDNSCSKPMSFDRLEKTFTEIETKDFDNYEGPKEKKIKLHEHIQTSISISNKLNHSKNEAPLLSQEHQQLKYGDTIVCNYFEQHENSNSGSSAQESNEEDTKLKELSAITKDDFNSYCGSKSSIQKSISNFDIVTQYEHEPTYIILCSKTETFSPTLNKLSPHKKSESNSENSFIDIPEKFFLKLRKESQESLDERFVEDIMEASELACSRKSREINFHMNNTRDEDYLKDSKDPKMDAKLREFILNSILDSRSSNMKKCSVPGCSDTTSMRHRFPKNDEDRMTLWLQKISNPALQSLSLEKIYNSHRVCRSHFADNCFSPGRKRLNGSAVPTLNLPL
ncbi:uncharacterized protein LOC107270174 [Cephus cinctus]|uniref:Uncharacterized protein LOC107270174 n=1 Tax=Cephus cinctus TaxID=211228 RepID=A0AAJ7C2K4_CEPCN|nr:uncharacterized protein LOC107270174 [Cephus cinctus]